MKKKNSGYTLVELIVSIAILAIVGIGVGTVIGQSMRQYRISNTEANLQQEAQLVGNQLTNLVIDANDGVSTGAGQLNIYDYDSATKMRSKAVIAFDQMKGRLTYSYYEMADGDIAWTAVDGEMEECLAEYVKSFSVKLLDADGAVITTTTDAGHANIEQVCITILYEIGDRSFDYEQTITMRNQILASSIVEGSLGNEESGTEEPGGGESGTEESGGGESGTDKPEGGESETDKPEGGESGTDKPGDGDSETKEPEVVMTGLTVRVPNGRNRTTTATITLTGTNLPTDDAKVSAIVNEISYSLWGKSNGWMGQGESWSKNPNGLSMEATPSVSATDTKYTITYTITVNRWDERNYQWDGCLKLQAEYGDLEGSDTFCFNNRW